jgi:hypothetical protein
MAEPHICTVNWETSDSQQEWVQVANGGLLPVAVTGLEITDYTRLQLNVHIYRFPPTTENTMLLLGTFESVIVYTGQGQNRWHIDDNGKRWLLLFMGRAAPIWNNTGDVVYLRNPDGTFVDTFTLGDPPRHPNGH